MLEGFRSLLPEGGDIVISEEASTYRPERIGSLAQLQKKHPEFGMARRRRGKLRTGARAGTSTASSRRSIFRIFRMSPP